MQENVSTHQGTNNLRGINYRLTDSGSLKTLEHTIAHNFTQNFASKFAPNFAHNFTHRLATLLLATLFLSNCAIPSSPTGGPPDKEPPRLASLTPANGTTNFADQTLSFTFNEYLNRQTFQRALSIEPDLNIPYKIDWKRTTATVIFEDPLPENTTIIVTLGTELTDIRSNKLKEPIQIALSTGPTIAKGEIRVRVANYEDGRTQEGRTVFLFRLDEDEVENMQGEENKEQNQEENHEKNEEGDEQNHEKNEHADAQQPQLEAEYDPTTPPLYVSQTDTAGIAKFIALADGLYRPIWIDDRNRSRTWQPDREPAQPFDTPAIKIEEGTTLNAEGEPDSTFTPQVWVYQPDTTAPTLLAVGVTSERRLRLRFSEPVKFVPPTITPAQTLAIYTIQDSLAQEPFTQEPFTQETFAQEPFVQNPFTQAIPLYVLPEDSTIIVAQTAKPLPADSTFWLAQDSNIAGAGIAEITSTILSNTILTSTNLTITDLAGNPWQAKQTQTEPNTFTGSTTSDQTELEIIQTSLTQNPNPLITDSLTITYNSLIEPSLAEPRIASLTQQIMDSTQFIWDNQLISVQETATKEYVSVLTRENRLLFAPGTENWPTTPSPTIQLYDPLTKSRNPLTPNFTDPEQFGDLDLKISVNPKSTVVNETDSLRFVIQLEKYGYIHWQIILDKPESAVIKTPSLPPGTYLLRYFNDADQDEKWDKGTLMDYSWPEYIGVFPVVEVVNGLTGNVEIVLDY